MLQWVVWWKSINSLFLSLFFSCQVEVPQWFLLAGPSENNPFLRCCMKLWADELRHNWLRALYHRQQKVVASCQCFEIKSLHFNGELPFPSWSRLVLAPWFHFKFGGQPCSKANRGGRDATSKREPVRAKLRVPRRELPVRKLPKLELILRNSLNMCLTFMPMLFYMPEKVFLTNQSRFVPA